MTVSKKKYNGSSLKPTTKLGKLRLKRGMTQDELAKRAGLPVRTLQKYERGEREIEVARIDRLCDLSTALDCRIEDILDDETVAEKIRSIY